MLTRIATGLIGGVLLLFLLLVHDFSALVVVALLHALAIYEYARLEPKLPRQAVVAYILIGTIVVTVSGMALAKEYAAEMVPALLAAFAIAVAAGDLFAYNRNSEAGQYSYLARAVLLVTLPFAFLMPIAHWPGGFPYLLLLIGASFGADVGGIFAGKLAGRHKLATRLSPKKTWEGLVGALLSAAACWMVTVLVWPLDLSFGMLPFTELPSGVQLALAGLGGAVTALFGVAGDLTFSLYKRQHAIKDYGALLPGHGGILDRFDAFIFCAPVVYLICLL
jgi:phosphatidate cytidylyltransferase